MDMFTPKRSEATYKRMAVTSKARRDRNRAAGICINSGPAGKIQHGPVTLGGKCARCVEIWRKSK